MHRFFPETGFCNGTKKAETSLTLRRQQTRCQLRSVAVGHPGFWGRDGARDSLLCRTAASSDYPLPPWLDHDALWGAAVDHTGALWLETFRRKADAHRSGRDQSRDQGWRQSQLILSITTGNSGTCASATTLVASSISYLPAKGDHCSDSLVRGSAGKPLVRH